MRTKKKQLSLRKETFKKIEQLHPHQTLLYVSMVGSCVIFLFMIVAFTASMPNETGYLKVEFPKSFVLSTLLLLSSSFAVDKIVPRYQLDDMDALKKWLGISFLMGLAFAALQFSGWQELQQKNILFSGDSSGTYLYVISGMHVIHLVGALGFCLYLLMEAHKSSKEPVSQLMYATSPYQKIKLKMLTHIWHFIDVLWVVLFVYFLFSF